MLSELVQSHSASCFDRLNFLRFAASRVGTAKDYVAEFSALYKTADVLARDLKAKLDAEATTEEKHRVTDAFVHLTPKMMLALSGELTKSGLAFRMLEKKRAALEGLVAYRFHLCHLKHKDTCFP